MALFKPDSPETKCLEGLRALHAHRDRLERTIAENEAELAKLRAGVSEDAALDAFLQGAPAVDSEGFPTSGRVRASAVEDKLTDLRGARVALCRRTRAAILDLGQARAGEFRHQAAKLQTLLDKHVARTAELLAELETHARAKYRVNLLEGTTVLTDGAGRESVFRRGDIPMPRSQELQREVEILRGKADAAEARARNACEGGQVAGQTIEELLKATSSIEILAPVEKTVRAWFEQAAAKAAAGWEATAAELGGTNFNTGKHMPAPEHDTVFTICWDVDGNLVESRCNWVNRPGRLTMPAAAPASVGAAADARRW